MHGCITHGLSTLSTVRLRKLHCGHLDGIYRNAYTFMLFPMNSLHSYHYTYFEHQPVAIGHACCCKVIHFPGALTIFFLRRMHNPTPAQLAVHRPPGIPKLLAGGLSQCQCLLEKAMFQTAVELYFILQCHNDRLCIWLYCSNIHDLHTICNKQMLHN